MTSWRDDTPQTVQDDLDAILTRALDVAELSLVKHGEFYPFAVLIDAGGQATLAMSNPGMGEHPPSDAMLSTLQDGLRENRETFRSIGFVCDVRVAGHDAVRVEAEHRDGGPAIACVAPYTRKGLRKKTVTFGQMAAMPGTRKIWARYEGPPA